MGGGDLCADRHRWRDRGAARAVFHQREPHSLGRSQRSRHDQPDRQRRALEPDAFALTVAFADANPNEDTLVAPTVNTVMYAGSLLGILLPRPSMEE